MIRVPRAVHVVPRHPWSQPHDPVLTLAARGGGGRSFFRGQCRWGRCCLTTTVEHFHYTRGFTSSVRTADVPAQTVNIDLCFVPATHTPHQSLPAVSGSSGRLVLSHRPSSDQPHIWPGQVFANVDRSYTEVMHTFATAAQQRYQDGRYRASAPPPHKEEDPRGQVRTELTNLLAQRRIVRVQWQQEDAAWQALWTERKAVLEQRRREQRTPDWTTQAEDAQWRLVRRQHDARMASAGTRTRCGRRGSVNCGKRSAICRCHPLGAPS